MNTTPSIALLRQVSKMITHGQPLWAMAWANEYFEADHPLRMALVRKAKSVINESSLNQAGVLQLLGGAPIGAIDPNQRITLSNERSSRKTRTIPTAGKNYERRMTIQYSAPREVRAVARKLR